MKASQRRELILKELEKAHGPVSATALAAVFGVSRQIIVGDIALLRATGTDIFATPRGYVLSADSQEESGIVRRIACNHTAEQMEKELLICIDYGCSVLDVIVEHPVYGQITGELQLKSRYDVKQFMEKVAKADAHALSELTDGIHLHTIVCPNEEVFEEVCKELIAAGIYMEEEK